MRVFYGESSIDKFDHCIWTNGCYDILHIGHFRLIEKCRTMASEHNCPLFVGIDSDKRVRELKGESRPINSEDIRAESLLSVRGVDRVFVYDTAEELQNLLQLFSPHASVIGEEYRTKSVVGAEYAKVVFFPKVEGYSTTKFQQLEKQP